MVTEIEQDWGDHDVLPAKLKLLRSTSCLSETQTQACAVKILGTNFTSCRRSSALP